MTWSLFIRLKVDEPCKHNRQDNKRQDASEYENLKCQVEQLKSKNGNVE